MNYIDIISYIAIIIQVLMWAPQLSKIVKHKSVEGVSLITYYMMNIVCFLWLLYTSLIGQEVLAPFITNFISLIIITALATVIMRYQNKNWIPMAIANTLILIGSLLILVLNQNVIPKWTQFFLAILAGLSSSLAFLPQVYKTVKLKELENFSATLGFLRLISTALWTSFFILTYVTKNNEIYIVNIIFLSLSCLAVMPILYMGFKDKK